MHIYPDRPTSEYFKCRKVIDEKEFSGSFTLNKGWNI
jgi:hypothetical protein